MTCIAYKDGVLAADRMMSIRGFAVPATKIHCIVTPEGREIVGVSGHTRDAVTFLEWLKTGSIDPKPTITEEDGFSAYVVKGGKLWHYESNMVCVEMDVPFWAWGCGGDLAMGAMAHGASAKEAVEIACRFDINCGLGVDVLETDK